MKLFKLLLIFIILFTAGTVSGQSVKIFDQQTGQLISNVLIYNTKKSRSSLSNAQGKADVSSFSTKDTLIFQHPSYQLTRIPYAVLKKIHFKVLLSESFVDLNEVVVSANRWEEKKDEIPGKISLIKIRDILLNNPSTSADMIAQGNDVYVQKSQLGGGSPMIRGFAANRILFVVDGVRMNNAIYRSGNLQNILQADVNSLASAEILFGPGTNIYGSGALGGVLDLHMITPQINDENKWAINGHVYSRLGSAAFEKSLHADLNIGNNQLAFLSSISLTDFNDLRMGSHGNAIFKRNESIIRMDGIDSIVANNNPNIQKYSGYSQMNFMQKILYNFNATSSINLGFYYSGTSDVPRYDRLTQLSHGLLKYARWYYRPQNWMMVRAGLDLHKKRKLYDQASFVFALQKVKEGRNDRKRQSEWLRQRVENVGIISVNAHFVKALSNDQHLYYGGQWDYNNVASMGEENNILTGETKVIASRYPDGGSKSNLAGLYVSYKKNLQELPLTFSSGIRFSYSSLLSNFSDTSFYHLPYTHIGIKNQSITGNAGLVYRPGQWQVRFNLSSGFRAPNLDDVAKLFDSEPGNVVVPNKNLKPEYLYNADIGISRSFGQKADIEMTVFYSYLKNAVVRRDFQLNGQDSIYYDGLLSRVQAMVNTGHAIIYGLSMEAELKLTKEIGFKSKLSYIRGRDDEANAMRHVPPLYGSSTLFYEQNKLQLEVSADYNGQLSYENLALSERDKAYLYAVNSEGLPYSPAWWTLNLRSNYAFSEHFLLSLSIENALDQRYRTYSSGISAPGINFIFALRYSF